MHAFKQEDPSVKRFLPDWVFAGLAPFHLNPPAAAFGSRELRLSMVTASHGLLNSLTFFCVSGSWFHASGPSQPPTERSHNNKRSAGEAECSSVSSAESLVVFTANRIPFQWVSAVFLEAPFYHTDCLVCRKLYRKK